MWTKLSRYGGQLSLPVRALFYKRNKFPYNPLLNKDTDGVKKGFDIEMLDAVSSAVDVPVIASGGAGGIEDFVTLFKTLPKVDAGLAASIFHFGEVSISDLKSRLKKEEIPVRI